MEWPRGEATDCKSVYTGSNPVSTSIAQPRRLWEVGPSRAIGAVVARFLDTEEVTGSNPVSPTHFRSSRHLSQQSGKGAVAVSVVTLGARWERPFPPAAPGDVAAREVRAGQDLIAVATVSKSASIDAVTSSGREKRSYSGVGRGQALLPAAL